MKIGILTFHYAHNYGAVLQALALQEYLSKLGHDAVFLDYQMDKISYTYRIIRPRRILRKNLALSIKEIKNLPARKKRFTAFDNFITKNLKTEPFSKDNINNYDLIIVGSDQVWNFNLTKQLDSPYWGNLDGYQNRLISYAASMEETALSTSEKEFIEKALSRFDKISVRENSLKKFLTPYTNKEISVVCDPTILMGKTFWEQYATENLIDEKYVLLYQVRESSKAYRLAEEIAKRKNARLIVLSASLDKFNTLKDQGIGPGEFLSLFKYAEFVVSASFHGLVFSLIFNKPFYSMILGDGKDSRVESLLNDSGCHKYGLKGENTSEEDFNEPNYDWNSINLRLNELRDKSAKYLSDI